MTNYIPGSPDVLLLIETQEDLRIEGERLIDVITEAPDLNTAQQRFDHLRIVIEERLQYFDNDRWFRERLQQLIRVGSSACRERFQNATDAQKAAYDTKQCDAAESKTADRVRRLVIERYQRES